jgi:hypothetical protein
MPRERARTKYTKNKRPRLERVREKYRGKERKYKRMKCLRAQPRQGVCPTPDGMRTPAATAAPRLLQSGHQEAIREMGLGLWDKTRQGICAESSPRPSTCSSCLISSAPKIIFSALADLPAIADIVVVVVVVAAATAPTAHPPLPC